MVKTMGPYGLGVTLYAFLNRVDIDSPYYILAKHILRNLDQLQNVSIKGLANQTHVSIATISRFCKEIGLSNFAELKNLINDSERATTPKYDFQVADSTASLSQNYLGAVQNDIEALMETISMKELEALVADIHHYQNVATFGAMHMETISLMLQNNLFRCKKIIETRLDPRKQIEFVENSQGELLLIIFSLSGNYVREYLANVSLLKETRQVKIYVITLNRSVAELKYVDQVILLPENANSFSAHPLDSFLLVNLITLVYYEQYIK